MAESGLIHGSQRRALVATALIFALTVGQLAVATFIPGLPQFEGKAFGARLVFYPVLMAILPAVAWLVRHRAGHSNPLPWNAAAFVMSPFLVDVTGNTLDLYDTVGWWDDANHFVNWALLSYGLGLLLTRAHVRPRWLLPVSIVGLGAVLAIAWELGEWYTFIRHGTELDTAYEDTLGDEALGTLGSACAATTLLLLTRMHPGQRPAQGRTQGRTGQWTPPR